MSKQNLASLFKTLNIEYTVYQHPPLENCQRADELELDRAGQRTKNLFLRDNYGRRHILLITTPEKSVDLKALSKLQQVSRIGFASAERLSKYLAVKPGSVSLLAIIADAEHEVELWLDDELSLADPIQCHPFNNEETWVVEGKDIQQFLSHLKREYLQVFVPSTTGK